MCDYIGKRGYTILKNNHTTEQLDEIRKELTVKPFSNYMGDSKQFPIYSESPNKLYIPRYYGLKKFNSPKKIRLNLDQSVNINFSKTF